MGGTGRQGHDGPHAPFHDGLGEPAELDPGTGGQTPGPPGSLLARYLDLEVDVIRRAGEAPFIVDREELAVLAKDGLIGPGLEKKALEVADGLLKNML